MSQYPKLNNYVSEIDKVLQGFDKEHPELSLSQHKEKQKYQRIYHLRDDSDRPVIQVNLWEDF